MEYTLFLVLLCIIGSVFANVQGTWFMKALVDDYILPMVKTGSTDFAPLVGAMTKVAGFYVIGILTSLIQAELMVFVTQGTLKHLRDAMFDHMRDFQLNILTLTPMEILCPVY